jgi:hypothetical protein
VQTLLLWTCAEQLWLWRRQRHDGGVHRGGPSLAVMAASTHIDMDIDVDMDMDVVMVRAATSTDARRSDSVCRTPPMNVAMRTYDGV